MAGFRETINECYKLCCRYEKKLPEYQSEDLFWEFADDMVNMAYLIAMSDGNCDGHEVTMINATFNILYDPILLMKRYGMDYMSEDSFLQKVPTSIRRFAAIEKADNMGMKCFLSDTRVLYQAFKEFGNVIINCDGQRLKFQVMLHKYFTDRIKNYIIQVEEQDELSDSMRQEAVTGGSGDHGRGLLNRPYSDVEAGSQVNTYGGQGMPQQKIYADPNIENSIFNSIAQDERVYERYGSEDTLRVTDAAEKGSHPLRLKTDRTTEKGHESVTGGRSVSGTGGGVKGTGGCDASDKSNSAVPQRSVVEPDMKKINAILEQVDNLIGLTMVKREIHNMVNLLLVRSMREKQGLKIPPISMHMVFAGNPGTGKTTIARMVAEIYKCLGLLKTGQLVETDRSGLVAGYMGQTAERVQEVAKSAMGGILFVDEAYSLAVGKTDGDFGQEAIDTLLKIMEDNRENFMVIVAGYTDKMEAFIDSNPGLKSRFSKYIYFDDYTTDELYVIFEKFCTEQDYRLAPGLEDKVKEKIDILRAEEDENFGNARDVRNYFERVITNQATRIMSRRLSGEDGSIGSSKEALVMITEEDL